MTSGQGELRRASVLRRGACVAFACGMLLAAPTPMADDISIKRLAPEQSIGLMQVAESGATDPSIQLDGTPGTVAQQLHPNFDDLDTAASGLNDALDGARSKLEQLREATEIAAIAATLREELLASAEENNRLAAALTEAEATQRSLEVSLERSSDQVIELTKSQEEARSEASALNQQLRMGREETAATDAARIAAEERAERAEKQLTDSRGQNASLSQENGALKDKLRLTRSERDKAKAETEVTREERDAAHQELDTIRLRIAGLLRSVLHADESIDAAMLPKGAAATAAETEPDETESADRTYKIVQTSNIRAEPRRDAERVDIGVAGESVSVLRKVPDDNWYEIETRRGKIGFIFGELIEPSS